MRRGDGYIDVTGMSEGSAATDSIPTIVNPLPPHLKEIVWNISYISSSIRCDEK